MSHALKTFYVDNSDCGFIYKWALARVSDEFNFSDVPLDVPLFAHGTFGNPGIGLRELASPRPSPIGEGDILSASQQVGTES